MLDAVTAYIKTITALTIFSILAELLLPEGRFAAFLRPVLGTLVLAAVLQPLFQVMHVEIGALESDLSGWREGQSVIADSLDKSRIEAVERTFFTEEQAPQEGGGGV